MVPKLSRIPPTAFGAVISLLPYLRGYRIEYLLHHKGARENEEQTSAHVSRGYP